MLRWLVIGALLAGCGKGGGDEKKAEKDPNRTSLGLSVVEVALPGAWERAEADGAVSFTRDKIEGATFTVFPAADRAAVEELIEARVAADHAGRKILERKPGEVEGQGDLEIEGVQVASTGDDPPQLITAYVTIARAGRAQLVTLRGTTARGYESGYQMLARALQRLETPDPLAP